MALWFKCAVIFMLTNFANVSVFCNLNHPLKRKLNTWHTLKQSDIFLHRHKRSLNDDVDVIVPLDKQVSFDAFDRTFTLSLMPSPEILTPGFKAFSQDDHGVEEVPVDKTSILTGTVMGDPKSHVTAHFDGKTLTANIETQNDTYVVEPMWRHLHQSKEKSKSGNSGEHDSHSDMVVYRQSDVNLMDYEDPHSKSGFCQSKDLMNSLRREQHKQEQKKKTSENVEKDFSHRRSKRSSGPIKICKLSLVADFRFFRAMGNSSNFETMYYLISLIERVNTIYKRTDWGPPSSNGAYKGYGFQINRIIIHKTPTRDNATVERYNRDGYWDARDLLEAFSETNYSECLSHLFTYYDFPKGLLGLAYVGSPKADDYGGICTKPYSNSAGKTLYLNTGLTSTVNWGDRILTTEADLVTAHELGHNFGADHDDDTQSSLTEITDCTPGQAHGGNYIMFPAAVSGQYANNNKFSDCSRHAILPTLLKKADKCFEEESKSFCGNYEVDEGETCDVGLFVDDDVCCFAHNCTLKPNAICSNKNSPCCTESCQLADTTQLCRAHIKGLCHNDTYCNGIDIECPEEVPAANGQECGDLGQCKDGKCKQYCTTKGLLPCLCSKPAEHQCKKCCAMADSDGLAMMDSCTPYIDNGTMKGVKENGLCVLGYCSEGVCQKHTQDVIERVWDVFQYIAPDKIGEALKNNIVGAVLIFSLLFWIPCSCLINFVDKKRLKEKQKEEKWYSERGVEYSRSLIHAFRGVGSNPTTPRIRVQRGNPNWNSGGNVMNSGLNAREQWRASQERGIAMRNLRSRENLNERLEAVPGSPNDDDMMTQSHPSLQNLPVNGNNNRPVLLSGSHSRSHPSLASPLSSLGDKSFDGEIKPIAVSSNTNLPALFENESPIVPSRTAGPFRHSLKRQEAVVSP